MGDEYGRVPTHVRPLRSGLPVKGIVCSDDFNSQHLGKHWQWNHNPVDEAWSLSERPGWMRLKTSRVVPNLYLAPNTLTQRMQGPTCSATVSLDISHLKDGDCAGFAAFNDGTCALRVRRVGRKLSLELVEMQVKLEGENKKVTQADEKVVQQLPLTSPLVWLRISGDFNVRRDIATFAYSIDGTTFTPLGGDYRMRFDWQRFFMGSKFALFCYATKRVGGWLDVDAFDFR